ncbi:MAG: YqeG family HAD IIIA-type phosphatase [Lachnospiraceae bacterium]|nr:YqeG family HAD IIIA-type phosphatase [Lachnospiraceae bacterium]
MLNKFKPDIEIDSVYHIDFDSLFDEGIRGIIFDIDNTLVAHDAPRTDESDALIKKLYDKGFKVFFVSNNDEDRVKTMLLNVNVDYIHKAGKPKAANYYRAFEIMGLDKSQVVAVGDQLFTDCLGAKNAGIKFIKVGIVDKKEPPHIVLKRILEKPVEILTKI